MEIKVRKGDVVWSYLGNFFQYFTSIIILPIVLSSISQGELGLWYSFASIGTLATYLDFGFSTTLVRNITYAWSGAKSIKKVGFDNVCEDKTIDIKFIQQILFTCRMVCLIVAIVALLFLLLGGTWYVVFVTKEFTNQSSAITSWLIYGVGVFLNIYYNYCTNTLRGIGLISESQKIVVFARVIQILVTYVGIKLGYGIIAMSTAYLISGFLIRFFSNIYINKEIRKLPGYDKHQTIYASLRKKLTESWEIFKNIWYNAKRSGIIALCSYAINQSLTLICSAYIGVKETANYGLCMQIITAILSTAGILFATYSPRMINAMALNQKEEFNRIFSFCIFVFGFLSVCGIGFFALFSTPLLELIHSNTIIPIPMFLYMGLYMFLEHNHGEFTAYFTMRNDICYLKSYVVASIFIVIGSWVLAACGLNIYWLMTVHFVVQIVYNNWYWPHKALSSMSMSVIDLLKYGSNESVIQLKKVLKVTYRK